MSGPRRERSMMGALCAMTALFAIPVHGWARERQAAPVDPAMAAIRKVYVSGQKKHEVKWADKHLAHFTCLEPVDSVEQADAILDLEPVDTPPPVEADAGAIIACRSTTSSTSCTDGVATETIRCRTGKNGDVTCNSYYYNLDDLRAIAEAFDRAAKTHVYLLTRDGKTLLWDYDESLLKNQTLRPWRDNWQDHLKTEVGCAKGQRGDKKTEDHAP